jgi:ubiquinone/menaquinone biosynthesis C-methylase UbiE
VVTIREGGEAVTPPYQTEDVQQFERWSRTYEHSWLQGPLFIRIHRAVLDLAAALPPPGTILDVGCGTGRLLRTAAARWPGSQLIGIDPAAGMVEVARRLSPTVTFHVGLVEALPLPDASVDLALSTASFHHWHHQATGVREIARVVRPGGHFILADVVLPSWLLRFLGGGRGLPASARAALLTAAGWRVLEQQTVVAPMMVATLAVR